MRMILILYGRTISPHASRAQSYCARRHRVGVADSGGRVRLWPQAFDRVAKRARNRGKGFGGQFHALEQPRTSPQRHWLRHSATAPQTILAAQPAPYSQAMQCNQLAGYATRATGRPSGWSLSIQNAKRRSACLSALRIFNRTLPGGVGNKLDSRRRFLFLSSRRIDVGFECFVDENFVGEGGGRFLVSPAGAGCRDRYRLLPLQRHGLAADDARRGQTVRRSAHGHEVLGRRLQLPELPARCAVIARICEHELNAFTVIQRKTKAVQRDMQAHAAGLYIALLQRPQGEEAFGLK